MRVAIIGAHPDSKLDAPYSDGSWTIWACSMKHMRTTPDGSLQPDLPRWDAWFELHTPMGLDVTSGQIPDDYVAWVRQQPVAFICDQSEQFPGARQFPMAQLKDRFGPYFFTSSIACMMAKAIADGAEDIGLWGVGMHAEAEYKYQLPGCHYFTQRAREAGITVTVPPGSKLLAPPIEPW